MAEVQIIKPSINAKHIENITKRTKKKKVCAYCRVSTDMEDQRTSYLSISFVFSKGVYFTL